MKRSHKILFNPQSSYRRRKRVYSPPRYWDLRQKGAKERASKSMTINRAGFAAIHALNRIKEFEIREKIRRGKKARVAFVVDRIASFKTASLYRAMERNPIYEPFIILYSIFEGRLGEDYIWENYKKEYKILTESGYQVHYGYDDRKRFIDPGFFYPDIVVTSALYYDIHNFCYTSTDFNLNYLVCAFNYGFSLMKINYGYYYNNLALSGAWIHFVETPLDYYEIRHYSITYGANAICLGSPFLDYYKQASYQDPTLPEFNNSNPVVIYAPHWSIPQDRNISNIPQAVRHSSSFLNYHNEFLEMIKNNPDVNFVFKPHPSLGHRLEELNLMSAAEYQEYKDAIASLPNGYIYEGSEYIKLFKLSSLLITDGATSFIVEYLPSGHPCIILERHGINVEDFLSSLTTLGQRVLETYYICRDWDHAREIFSKIIYRHRDPFKSKREEAIENLFVNLGDAGEKIEQYISGRLTD